MKCSYPEAISVFLSPPSAKVLWQNFSLRSMGLAVSPSIASNKAITDFFPPENQNHEIHIVKGLIKDLECQTGYLRQSQLMYIL